MDGLKKLFKSRKFLGALVSCILIAFEATYFKDHPAIAEIIIGTSAAFGIQIAGQAHADANNRKYDETK